MARLYEEFDEYRHGKLVVEECEPDCVEVFYIPSREKLDQAGLDGDKGAEHRVKLLVINRQKSSLTISPVNARGNNKNFLKPKYSQVQRITLADGVLAYAGISDADPSISDNVFEFPCFGPTEPLTPDEAEALSEDTDLPSRQEQIMTVLESLPPAFIKDYDYGLGLAKSYRFIVEAVEQLSDCTEIVISETHETEIDHMNKIFYISADDFETARRTLKNIDGLGQNAMRSVKKATIHNILADKIGRPKVPVKTGQHQIRKRLTAAMQGERSLDEAEQEALLNSLTENTKAIAESKPEKLAKLQNEIELVTLEHLIARYEQMIGKKLGEPCWQAFFNQNLFILNLAFGYPFIKVQDQASVGGRKLSGSGEKITDYLVKNTLTNNAAIFEIKTPQANLLNKKPFRDGIYTPSSGLSGAINQALDQKYQFQTHIATMSHDSRIHDLKCVHFDTKNFRKGLPSCSQSALAGSPTPKILHLKRNAH